MAEAVCTNHPDVGAVGKCFQCKKFFCLDCLDLDTGKPICKDCLAGKPEEAAVVPPPVEPEPIVEEPLPTPPEPVMEAPVFSPIEPVEEKTDVSLNDLDVAAKEPEEIKQPAFKVTGNLAFMDSPSDSAVSANKPIEEVKAAPPAASKVTGPLAFMDAPNDTPKPNPVEDKKEMPAFIPPKPVIPSVEAKPKANPTELPPLIFKPMKSLDNDPLGLFKENAAPPGLNPSVPKSPAPTVMPTPAPMPTPKPVEPLPAVSFPPMPDFEMKKPAHVSNVDMAGMMKKLDTTGKAPVPAKDIKVNSPTPQNISTQQPHDPKKVLLSSFSSLGMGFWKKFENFSGKLKIPGYLLAAILFVLVAGGLTFFLQKSSLPAVKVVDTIPQITIVSMDSSQVPNLDITAFTEMYTHLGQLGFIQILQMTVPQLLPNFFDVGMKEDEGIYSEILMMPNQIAPRLSFVTVFTNGVWYSTNGWAGTGQQLDYLVSEFYPDQTPEQLYDQHKQGIQKLQTANGWQVQNASQNRYMADLSDHLRWYLKFKNISADQLDFASWH
jgi:hypothetical protein